MPEREAETREVTGIASRVVLDRGAGTATKEYRRRLPIWILYWITFQAPFPYATNSAARRAAQYRRRIAGLITRFFLGRDVVAPVVAVRREGGRFQFVTALVEGGAPGDKQKARHFLHEVTQAFIQTGLPTWQISPYNPRVLGNLLETPDGDYWIIDLESNVVTPFLPARELWSAARQRHVPPFDDIDLPRLWSYIFDHWEEMGERLGEDEREELVRAVSLYQWYERLWQGAEPRIWSRAIGWTAGLLDVPRHIRRLLLALPGVRPAGRKAEDWLRAGIDRWREEGRITEAEAGEAEAGLKESDVLLLLANLGAHMAMSVPLRFPLGAIARFSWTASHRLAAEARAVVRRRADAETRAARSIHTLPVLAASALPGVGSASYVLAAPIRRNRVLTAVAIDRALGLLPFGIYEGFHVQALTTDMARAGGGSADGLAREMARALKDAPGRLASHLDVVAAVLVLNAVALGIATGGTLYKGGTWFGESGPVALFGALQLAAGGVLGISTYVAYWSWRPSTGGRGPSLGRLRAGALSHGVASDTGLEAARTFFWLAAGAGLLWMAADDVLNLHGRVAGLLPRLPLAGKPDDLIVIAYAVLALVAIRLFVRHLLASPAQFALVTGALVFGLLSLVFDFALAEIAPLDEVEEGLQLVAGGFVVSAAGVAYREAVGREIARLPVITREAASAARGAAFAPTRRNVLHWMSWAVALGALTSIILLVAGGGVYGWEVDVAREVQSWGYPLWLFRITSEDFTDPMSHIGAGVFLAAAGLLWFSGRRVEALIVLLIFPLHVLGNFPKALVERDRPSEVIDGISGVGGAKSFPSGHAEYVITFFGFLVFLGLLELRLGWQRALLVTAWLAFAVLCGVGRIAYGRHWPLDVLASYVTGAGLLSGLVWLYMAFRAPLGAGRERRAERRAGSGALKGSATGTSA